MARFQPPTLEQCEAYAREKGFKFVDGATFWFWFDAIDWVVGKAKTKMVRWRSAMAGWEARGRKKHKIGKVKLYPIKGKTCSERGCGMPAVYKKAGEYDWYYCPDHLPAKVKEQYY